MELSRKELVRMEYALYITTQTFQENQEEYAILRQRVQRFLKIEDMKLEGRKFCKHGHELTEKNTRILKNVRICRKCDAEKQDRYRESKKGKL